MPPADAQGSAPPEERPFKIVGHMPLPDARPSRAGTIVHLDPERELLYYVYQNSGKGGYQLVEYDIGPEIPQPTREEIGLGFSTLQIPDMNPNFFAVDDGRRKMYALTAGAAAFVVQDFTYLTTTNLETLEIDNRENLTTKLPGFDALGITYAEADDRVYLLGEMDVSKFGHTVQGARGRPAGIVPTVVALDAQTQDLAWVRPVPQCEQTLSTFSGGPAIFRSAHHRALYFACVDSRIMGSGGIGQPGLVRLSFPAEASSADAAAMDVEFFPVSGVYQGTNQQTAGEVYYDPVADRVFLASLAPTTPSVWVFDGRLSAWVGSVGVRAAGHRWAGINPVDGRLYVGGATSGEDEQALLVTDGRATPPPQGFEDVRFKPERPMVVDPRTGRVFVGGDLVDDGDSVTEENVWVVVKDTSEPIDSPPATNHDALTDDIPEDSDTSVNFTGSVRAFGSRVRLVGGAEGAYAGAGGGLVRPFTALIEDRSPLRLGDRGLTVAHVAGLDLGGFGATAAAGAVRPDGSTNAERGNVQQQVSSETDSSDEDSPQPSDVLDDRYPLQECSDGGSGTSEKSQSDPARLGEAHVVCDLGQATASASASFDGAVGPLDETVSVASSSTDSSLERHPDLGTVARTAASAGGMTITTSAGTIAVDRVTTSVETAAKGRTGTSFAKWVRRVDGLVVHDPDGAPIFPPDGSGASCVSVAVASGGDDDVHSVGSCDDLETRVNDVIQNAAKVRFPDPEIVATPKGAFAGVSRNEQDAARKRTLQNDRGREAIGLEAVVFNDGAEKSRLVVELAAVSSDSIYTITQFQSFDGDSGPGLDFDAPGTSVPDGDLPPPDLEVPAVGTDEQLVSELSGFLSNVDPSQLVDPPTDDRAPALEPTEAASEPSGEPGALVDTGGVSSLPGMSTATAPQLGDDVDGGEPAPQVAAPADQPADTAGGDQPQASGMTGAKMLARSPADAALVGGIWMLFLAAIGVVMRRSSLLQLLRP